MPHQKLIPTWNHIAELNPGPYPAPIGNLEHPWQQVVAHALAASKQNLPYKMNAAQRAISARLVEIKRSETEEFCALKEGYGTYARC